MNDTEIIMLLRTIQANDATIKDRGISDNLWGKAAECIEFLQSENAALRERLDITKMALEYACLETLQSNEQYLEELKEKVNKYIKQSEDVVYGQKNGATFRFAEVRLAELKGGEK